MPTVNSAALPRRRTSMGLANIDGRPVAVGGEDFTVRGGISWSGDRKKGGQGGFIEDLAASYRIPLVNLIDGSGGSVTSINRRGHAVFPGVHGFERSVELLGKVPVVSAVLGTAAGGPAGRAILSHWSVMVKGDEPGVRGRTAGGGALLSARRSRRRSWADPEWRSTLPAPSTMRRDRGGLLRLIRRFLSYMPSNVWELPPSAAPGDPVDRCEESLLRLVPAIAGVSPTICASCRRPWSIAVRSSKSSRRSAGRSSPASRA